MLFASMGLLVFSTVLVALLRQWRTVAPALATYALALALATWSALGVLAGLLTLLGSLIAIAVLTLPKSPRGGSGPRGEAVGRAADETMAAPQYWRLLALALAVVGSYGLTLALPLGGSTILTFAAYWLLIVGAVVLLGTRDVLRSGLGLLLLAGSGTLVVAALADGSDLLAIAASGLVQVFLALAFSRLAEAGAPRRQGGEA